MTKRNTRTISGKDLQIHDIVPTADWGDVRVDHLRTHPNSAGDWVQWYGVGEGQNGPFVVAPMQKMDEPITILQRMDEITNSKIIIDHDLYGDRTEFATIEEAQATIRDCGPEFANTTLEIQGGNAIYDQRGECIGRIDY